MNNNIRKITEGAMMTALVGVIVLIDRYTAGFFQAALTFIIPLPIAIYCAKYGFKESLVPFVSMTLIAFFSGMLTTTFLVINSCVTGIVFGYGVYHKKKSSFLFFTTLFFTAFSYLVTMILFSGAFGYNIVEEMTILEDIFTQAIGENVAVLGDFTIKEFIMVTFPIAIVFSAVLEAAIIYFLAHIILRRFKIEMPKLTKYQDLKFPKWLAYLMLVTLLGNQLSSFLGLDRNISMIIFVLSSVSLFIFMIIGFMTTVYLIRRYGKRNYILIFYCLFLFMAPIISVVLVIIGAFDTCGNLKKEIDKVVNNVR